MFCKNCGKEVPDNTKFCPACGTNLSLGSRVEDAANKVFQSAEQELKSSINEVQQSLGYGQQQTPPPYGYDQQQTPPPYGYGQQQTPLSYGYGQQIPPYTGIRLKDDRGLLSYILLSIITCGIYGYYFIYKMAADVNIACAGDGEQTSGLAAFIILSYVTCGIYAWIWYYKLGNRLAANAGRYGLSFQENGTTVLMWQIFGALLCGIGPYVAMYILIKNSNRICNAYNRMHNL